MPNLTMSKPPAALNLSRSPTFRVLFDRCPWRKMTFPSRRFRHLRANTVSKFSPFGLACSPWSYMIMMSKVLQGIDPDAGLLCYIDDQIMFNATWEGHFKLLERLSNALLETGLTLKPSKINAGPKQVNYLGQVLCADGISIGNDRTHAITEVLQPRSIKIYDLVWACAISFGYSSPNNTPNFSFPLS